MKSVMKRILMFWSAQSIKGQNRFGQRDFISDHTTLLTHVQVLSQVELTHLVPEQELLLRWSSICFTGDFYCIYSRHSLYILGYIIIFFCIYVLQKELPFLLGKFDFVELTVLIFLSFPFSLKHSPLETIHGQWLKF